MDDFHGGGAANDIIIIIMSNSITVILAVSSFIVLIYNDFNGPVTLRFHGILSPQQAILDGFDDGRLVVGTTISEVSGCCIFCFFAAFFIFAAKPERSPRQGKRRSPAS
jgi:hypothetical protein